MKTCLCGEPCVHGRSVCRECQEIRKRRWNSERTRREHEDSMETMVARIEPDPIKGRLRLAALTKHAERIWKELGLEPAHA